jgi:hypothetical protein
LRHRHTLTRRIDRERIALPRGNNRMRLHRIVILRRGLVGLRDRGFRRSELILDIAALRLRREAGADGLQREGFAGIKADPRRLGRVAWRKQACAFGRGFERFGNDDRDRLTDIADAIVLQQIEPEHEGIGFLVRILCQSRPVRWRDHLDHARMGFRRSDSDMSNAAACDARCREYRIEHAGRMLVGGILGRAGHFENAIAARERLTDIRAVADVNGRLCERDLRHV